MKSAIGMAGISVADFYNSEPREILIILEGYRHKQEREFQLMQIAVTNAIGLGFKKGFKPQNPFKEANTESKSVKSSKEEKEGTLNYLFNKFSSVGEIDE